MELKLFKSVWGMTGSIEENFSSIAEAGYHGVEALLPNRNEENLFKEMLEKYNLDYIAQILTVDDHKKSFEDQAIRAMDFNPLKINAHSASDCMDYKDQLDYFQHALVIEKKIGIPVGHETHRKRSMFTPWNTASLLRDLSELKITADFSHWCCVCERLLEDQQQNLDIAIGRTIHIHGRVGYAEGPQVPDPRAPEYENELIVHENWWDRIFESQLQRGIQITTFTPEFGPPQYMHTLPFTNQPVSDLWDVCLWMGNHIKSRFIHYKL